MDFKRAINKLRRNLLQKLTRRIGTSSARQQVSLNKNHIQRILISRPNHRLGNLLLMTPLVQELSEIFPNAKIDLLIKGNLGTLVFKNYPNLQLIQLPKKPFKNMGAYLKGWMHVRHTRYDFAINVIKTSSSGRLSIQFAKARYKFFGDDIDNVQSRYSDYQHMAKQPVYYFRYCLSNMGIMTDERPVPAMDIKLTAAELAAGKDRLRKLVNNDRKVICLFTYATGDKCYSPEWWNTFYERLQKEYPDFNIIEILPVENISNIQFKAPTYSHKDIRDVGAVIANTTIFVGADSGVMHLSGAVNAPTLGFFSVTDEKSYQPYNGKSFGLNTNHNTVDDYIKAMNHLLH